MTDEQGYNGWSNYETWSVALIINNDQGTQEQAFEVIREAMENAPVNRLRDPIDYGRDQQYAVSQALRDWVTEEVPTAEQFEGEFAYLWDQLLGAALSEVDWYDLAETFMRDLQEASEDA